MKSVEIELLQNKIKLYEIMFHLAAQDILFFGDWDDINKCHGMYFSPAVLCNDTFYYACGDAESIQLEEVEHLEHIYNTFGEDGVVAWVSKKRGGLSPLKELQSDNYLKAVEYLKDKDVKVENIEMENME